MIDISEKKDTIISFLKIHGPALPVRIAREIKMDPVFASAILSELLNEKRLILSNLKIGASPLYLLPGQQNQLENFTENLKSAEKEAFLKLKEEKVLHDEKEGPSIRVSLRNLKDFAKPFKSNEKILWKYAFATEEKINNLTSPKKEQKQKVNIPKIKEEVKKMEKEIVTKLEKLEKPKPSEEVKKEKMENIFEESPTNFSEEVKKFLKKNNLEFKEEIQISKKEIVAKINMKTPLGDFNMMLIAKNKKSIVKEELQSAIQRATYSKMPCLYLVKKEPTKSIETFLKPYKNICKIKVLK